MAKKILIVISGSLTYWLLGLLLHEMFENVTETLRVFEILITASIGPFIFVLIVSLLIKINKGWVYGCVSYFLYFLWVFIFSPIFESQFNGFAEHLITMAKIYIVLGIISILSSAFGGFLGKLWQRRVS